MTQLWDQMAGRAEQPDLRAEHTTDAIRARLEEGPAGPSYLRDFLYGAIDGAVTTFAVVMGALGAQLGAGVVLVLGFANLAADGFSMAVGNLLGTRAENQQREQARRRELWHIEVIPEGEREEVRQIFAAKGLRGEVLEGAVAAVTADPQRWVDTMLVEELGLSLHGPVPWRAALATFVAFVSVGMVPLVPFAADALSGGAVAQAPAWSAGLTGVAFVLVGAAKSWVVDRPWWSSAAETLIMGGAAAGLALAVGKLLGGFAAGG